MGEVLDDGQDLADHLRIQGRGRLVEQENLRLGGQCPGDGDALLLAARELAGEGVGLIRQPDLGQHRLCDSVGLGGILLQDFPKGEAYVLPSAQVRIQIELLEYEAYTGPKAAELLAPGAGGIDSVDEDIPPRGGFQAIDHPDQGGLPRSGWPADHDHAPAIDGQ